MERIRLATSIFCFLLLAQIVRAVRREHIRVEYSMAWLAAVCALLGLSLSDTALEWVAELIGVRDFAIVLLLLAGLAFLFTFFRVTVEVSALKDHNIVVTQKVGMLEWEMERQADEIRRLRTSGGDTQAPSQARNAERDG